jgi:uncharacterized protein (DUF2384 family)
MSNRKVPKHAKRTLETHRSEIIVLGVRLARMIENQKITADKLSPEENARMVRLAEIIDEVLKE